MLQAFIPPRWARSSKWSAWESRAIIWPTRTPFGFRAEKPAFEALMYRMVDGIDGQQLPKGSGTRMVSTITDFRSAALEETGRKQGLRHCGRRLFALYDPDTGEIFLHPGRLLRPVLVSADKGRTEQRIRFTIWRMERGRQVLDTNGYPIVVTDAEARQPVGVFTIQYLDGLQHVGSGRFVTTREKRCGVDEPLGGAPGLSGELQCGLGF